MSSHMDIDNRVDDLLSWMVKMRISVEPIKGTSSSRHYCAAVDPSCFICACTW